ncbi:hypothetical protein D3C84_869740 [compost metagenome]
MRAARSLLMRSARATESRMNSTKKPRVCMRRVSWLTGNAPCRAATCTEVPMIRKIQARLNSGAERLPRRHRLIAVANPSRQLNCAIDAVPIWVSHCGRSRSKAIASSQ